MPPTVAQLSTVTAVPHDATPLVITARALTTRGMNCWYPSYGEKSSQIEGLVNQSPTKFFPSSAYRASA